ncbi:hypothetical protein [uncultured Shewanella sp.]|uniref:hypothetical protein n=1 Tax=uncultured Shewanella sp. TaxID=173975 RepID=UPI002607DF8B|nr:hypothetical protein [uncultured Shewanella sp.]
MQQIVAYGRINGDGTIDSNTCHSGNFGCDTDTQTGLYHLWFNTNLFTDSVVVVATVDCSQHKDSYCAVASVHNITNTECHISISNMSSVSKSLPFNFIAIGNSK